MSCIKNILGFDIDSKQVACINYWVNPFDYYLSCNYTDNTNLNINCSAFTNSGCTIPVGQSGYFSQNNTLRPYSLSTPNPNLNPVEACLTSTSVKKCCGDDDTIYKITNLSSILGFAAPVGIVLDLEVTDDSNFNVFRQCFEVVTPTPTQTQTPDGCQQMYFVVCKSPNMQMTTLSISGDTLFNGKPYFKLGGSDQIVVYWQTGGTNANKWISSISGLTGPTENTLNISGSLPIPTIDEQWEFDCDTLTFKNNVVVNSYLGPCITPTPTPTMTSTPTKTRNTCKYYEIFVVGGGLGVTYNFSYFDCDFIVQNKQITSGNGSLMLCGIEGSFTSSSPEVNFGPQNICP